jgi:hypothetical protein
VAVWQNLAVVFEQDHAVTQQTPALFRVRRDHMRGFPIKRLSRWAFRHMEAHGSPMFPRLGISHPGLFKSPARGTKPSSQSPFEALFSSLRIRSVTKSASHPKSERRVGVGLRCTAFRGLRWRTCAIGTLSRADPLKAARCGLVQLPVGLVFEPMVMSAQRRHVAYAGRATPCPGNGVIQIAATGRS